MENKKLVSLLVVLALVGLVWRFRAPLLAVKDKAAVSWQKRMAQGEEQLEIGRLTACLNKSPNMTLVAAGFSPDLATPTSRERTLLITVVYTEDLSISREVRLAGFGEAHRNIFQCALDLKTDWNKATVYYVSFTSTPVLDDAKRHIIATVTMSISASREFISQIVVQKDVFAFMADNMSYAGEMPEAKIVLADLTDFNIILSRRAANGDPDLALKRYSNTSK